MNWTTLEDAIRSWVATASGLTTIWRDDNGPRPATQFIDLSATVAPIGLGWTVYADAVPPDPGAELTETARFVRELTLSLRCFGAPATGPNHPAAVLESVLAQASLDAVRDPLNVAGWVPARSNPILKIGGPIGGSVFEPRAELTCFGLVSSEVVGTSTYIQIVKVTNNLTGVETTLDSEAP
jgi:hypothetical protein